MDAVDKSNLIPRYLQVRSILDQRIRSGEFKPGDRIPSERDLAKTLDVSQMTVNKAIALLVREGWLHREHGNGTYVNCDLQVPAPANVTIGFAIPALSATIEEDYFISSLLRGIQKASFDRPISLRMLDAHDQSLGETISQSDMDGFIVVDLLDKNRASIDRLAREGKRILILGASDESVSAPYIDGDNIGGTTEAVEHLLSLGHTRVAGLFALIETWNSKQRHHAFVETMARSGHRVPLERILIDGGNGRQITEQTADRLRKLFRGDDRPTAILCGGFFIALDAMHLIKSIGLRIPEDVSLVGYDDPTSARYLNPPLTTVRQPLDDMGEQSIVHLYDWIHLGTTPPARTVHKQSLVIRSSTSQVQGRGGSPPQPEKQHAKT